MHLILLHHTSTDVFCTSNTLICISPLLLPLPLSCDITENIDGPDKANFLKEIEMMKKVSGTNHDHQKFVVNMLGCVTLQEPMMLVLEYATCGDLLSYLRDSRDEVCIHKMYMVVAQCSPLHAGLASCAFLSYNVPVTLSVVEYYSGTESSAVFGASGCLFTTDYQEGRR